MSYDENIPVSIRKSVRLIGGLLKFTIKRMPAGLYNIIISLLPTL